MGCWVRALARVEFYAGSQGFETPRTLELGGETLDLEVLAAATVSRAGASSPERVWLVRGGATFFRIGWRLADRKSVV